MGPSPVEESAGVSSEVTQLALGETSPINELTTIAPAKTSGKPLLELTQPQNGGVPTLEVKNESQREGELERESEAAVVVKSHNAGEASAKEELHQTFEHVSDPTPPLTEPVGANITQSELLSAQIEEDGENREDASNVGSLDVDSNETDSALGDMTPMSSTMSMRSSLYDYVAENGRTYHRYKQGKYALPNDETEQNRLDIQHQLFVHTLHGKLHLAPLGEDIHNVLDIATGTGIWAIDFAIKYPTANVLGTDLSPIQPEFVPPNCRFEVDDAEDDWNYSYKFDYIHGRLLLSCFNQDFPGIIAKSYESLNPGGWIELQDLLQPICFDNSWDGSDMQKWVRLTLEGAKRLGMDWNKVSKYREWIEAAGFEDVQEYKGAWPTNTWPRDKHYKLLGAWQNANMMEGVQGISMACLTRGLGMTAQEVEVMLIGVRRDLCDRNIHCYFPVRVIWGRKPGRTKTGQLPTSQIISDVEF